MQSTKKIGDHIVHPLGIGTWLVGGDFYVESKTTYALYGDEQKYIKGIRYSIEKGQNHIDTAQMYGAGHTEEVVGQAIQGQTRENLFIASKVWRSHATQLAVPHAIQEMLHRLQTTYLDLTYIHAPFPEVPMAEYIRGLNDAVNQGLTKYIGVSNFSLDQLKQAVELSKYPITAVQNHYNLLHKSELPAEMQAYCRENHIAMVAYRPVGRKMLADECTNTVLLDMAKKYQKTPAQIALNWLVAKEDFFAIPKAIEQKHIDENIASLAFEISSEDLETLNNLPDEVQK
jgi:diketogulonate reductase-like aldo/keto reductase